MNLLALPELRAAQNPEGPAVADDTVSLNNTEFLQAVRRASAALHRHGVAGGDVVAVMLPNTAGFVVALFAAWRVGAAVTPINPSLRPAEVTYQLADADAKVLIVDTVPDFDIGARPVITASDLTSTPDGGQPGPAHRGDDSLALLIYTSGTTGRPKGVMLDHANLIAMCRSVIDTLEIAAADHSLLILPLFHVNAIVLGTVAPLLAGGRTTIAGRFSPKTFFDKIEQSGATYFSAVPTIYTMLCGLPAEVKPEPRRSGSPSVAPHRPASSCSDNSNRVTTSRSSRATAFPREPAPARSIRWTAHARPGPWDCRCPVRASGCWTPMATRCPTARPGRWRSRAPT
jgi:long-chain acyl-CoA synthetase